MFRNFGPGEIALLVLLLVVVLGWKKLPDAARSVGRSMRIFKSEVEEMKNDGKTPSPSSRATVPGDVVGSNNPVQDHAVPQPSTQPNAAPSAGAFTPPAAQQPAGSPPPAPQPAQQRPTPPPA